MANMTSQTDETRRAAEGGREAESTPSPMARAAAGASTLTNQQLRRARERMDEQISSQRDRVTGRVRTLSRALRGAGEMLEEDELVAQCLHFVGDKAEGVASYVDELDPQRAAEDLRGLARDRPAWFFGGAFVLGLALGRFARSTAQLASASEPPMGTRVARNTSGPARTGAGAQRQTRSAENNQMRTGAQRP